MNNALVTLLFLGLSLNVIAQNCVESTSYTNLDVNNVSAGLLGGGDLWWDLSNGKYMVPKPQPGDDPISAIFAGAIWIGGLDSVGNLKLAAQSYRQSGNDYWPGPILSNPLPASECLKWDRHFSVLGSEITAFLLDYNDNGTIDDSIPNSILTWPASGNIYAFSGQQPLPIRDLAPFKDQNNDNIYDPTDGDHPILGLEDCQEEYADQMIWWVVNDIGNTHSYSNSTPIGLEMQVMAYAFTNPPFENTTFYTYDIINQSNEDLFDTYIGQWVDVDLGCWNNDFVGCDSARSMAIAYNGTATDPDCNAGPNIIHGYGNNVPLLGIDIISGPKNSSGQALPMTSFVQYFGGNSPQSEPQQPAGFYTYMKGFWRDGSPVEYGGDGYQENTYPHPFMFSGDPTDPNGWSECGEGNNPSDRRFIMGSGPFDLPAGNRNEFTIAVIFEPNVPHPCPSFAPLQVTSDSIQALFDLCFDGILSNNEQVVPNAFQALSVYPNPTTHGKGITITEVPANARLEISNINGNILYTASQANNSTQDFFWNLKTDNGMVVGQGLYFVAVRLEGVGQRVFKVSVF